MSTTHPVRFMVLTATLWGLAGAAAAAQGLDFFGGGAGKSGGTGGSESDLSSSDATQRRFGVLHPPERKGKKGDSGEGSDEEAKLKYNAPGFGDRTTGEDIARQIKELAAYYDLAVEIEKSSQQKRSEQHDLEQFMLDDPAAYERYKTFLMLASNRQNTEGIMTLLLLGLADSQQGRQWRKLYVACVLDAMKEGKTLTESLDQCGKIDYTDALKEAFGEAQGQSVVDSAAKAVDDQEGADLVKELVGDIQIDKEKGDLTGDLKAAAIFDAYNKLIDEFAKQIEQAVEQSAKGNQEGGRQVLQGEGFEEIPEDLRATNDEVATLALVDRETVRRAMVRNLAGAYAYYVAKMRAVKALDTLEAMEATAGGDERVREAVAALRRRLLRQLAAFDEVAGVQAILSSRVSDAMGSARVRVIARGLQIAHEERRDRSMRLRDSQDQFGNWHRSGDANKNGSVGSTGGGASGSNRTFWRTGGASGFDGAQGGAFDGGGLFGGGELGQLLGQGPGGLMGGGLGSGTGGFSLNIDLDEDGDVVGVGVNAGGMGVGASEGQNGNWGVNFGSSGAGNGLSINGQPLGTSP